MVELKFRPYVRPYVLAYTLPSRLDTIYIPTAVRENIIHVFQDLYRLSPEEAARAADLFLEEIYPDVLAHETAHLALGHIAQEEGLSVPKTMDAYHHAMIKEIEDVTENLAKMHAVERAQAQSRKLK